MVSLMKIKRSKHKVLHLGRNSPRHQYMLGQTAGKQIFRKGPGGLEGQQVEHESAICPCDKERQQHLGVSQQRCRQQVQGSDSSSHHWGDPIGVLCPVLGSPIEETQR